MNTPPEKACARSQDGRHEKLTDGRAYHASSESARFSQCVQYGVFSSLAKIFGPPFWWAEQQRSKVIDEIARMATK